MPGKKYDTLDEQKRAMFYESVRVLRDNDHFKVYLDEIREMMEDTKDRLITASNMEEVTRLQMYYIFMNDLLRVAYDEEPNPEPPTNE